MMIVYPSLNLEIELDEESIYTLVLEDQAFFAEFISDIYQQMQGCSGKVVISKNYEPINVHKQVELILQFIPFEMNKKALITKLHNRIQKESMSAQRYEQTQRLLAQIDQYIADLTSECEGEIISELISDITPLLKMYQVRFEEDHPTIGDALAEYMFACREYMGIDLFVVVNFRSYSGDKETELFFETLLCHKINALFVESRCYPLMKNEKRTIVDNDMCII